jgi:hypothetical protein
MDGDDADIFPLPFGAPPLERRNRLSEIQWHRADSEDVDSVNRAQPGAGRAVLHQCALGPPYRVSQREPTAESGSERGRGRPSVWTRVVHQIPQRPIVLPNSRHGRQINCSRQRICTLPGMRRGGNLSFSLRKSAITSRHCSDEVDCGRCGINPKGVLPNQKITLVAGKDSKIKATLARARPR